MSLGKAGMALAIICIGIYFFLQNLHIISPGMMSQFGNFIPLIIIAFALLLLLAPLLHGHRPHMFWGLFLGLYGSLLLADQYGKLTFHWQDFWKLWPYLIVYFGLSLLFGHTHAIHHRKRLEGRVHHKMSSDGGAAWRSTEKFVNEATFRSDNWMAQPLDEHVRIGDYLFDFTKAFIPDETIPIHLSGWLGDIKITVPEDLAFQMHLKAKVGEAKIGNNKQSGMLKNISYKTANYDEASRRLDFDFDFQVIDLRINQV